LKVHATSVPIDPAENQPLACTLSGSEMRARRGWLADLDRDRVSGRPTADGIVVRYRRRAGIESELRELVAAESRCCAFLDFEIRSAGDFIELHVSGAPEARPIIEAMFEAGGSN
jgi:hypothetical protein